jgi:hypothetical protein
MDVARVRSEMNVAQHVPLQCRPAIASCAAHVTRNSLQCLEVHPPVFLQLAGRTEKDAALAERALEWTGDRRRVQISERFQDSSTRRLLTALVTWCGLLQVQLGGVAGEQLLVGEPLQQHLDFSPSADATARVLLQLGLRFKPFAAHLASSSGVRSPVGSESGQLVSGDASCKGDNLN